MKKNFTYFFMLLATLLIVGCSSDNKEPVIPDKDALTVAPSSVVFNSGDYSSKSLVVTTNVKSGWKAVSNDTWIKTDNSGGALSVSVGKYTYGEDTRVGTITVTAGEATPVVVTVTQAPEKFEKPILKVLPESLSFGVEGGSDIVNVVSNLNWEVVSSTAWITFDINSETKEIAVHATMNNLKEQRVAELTLSAPEVEPVIVKITQEKLIFETVQSEILFPAEGGEKVMAIEVNTEKWEINYESEWFTAVRTGIKESPIKITVNAGVKQKREGSFSISIPGLEVDPIVVKVVQEETTFSATPTELKFTAEGETKIVKIETNLVQWTAEGEDVMWVDFTNNIEKKELTVTVHKSQTTSIRTSTITLKPVGSTVDNIIISIEQEEGEEPQLPFIWNRTSAEYMNIGGDVQSVSYYSDFSYNFGTRTFLITDLVFNTDNNLQSYIYKTNTGASRNATVEYDGEKRVSKIVCGDTGNVTIEFTYADHGKLLAFEEFYYELITQAALREASFLLWMPRLVKNLVGIKLTDTKYSYNNARYEVKTSGNSGSISKFDQRGSETPNHMTMTFDGDMLNTVTFGMYPNTYEAKYNINPISGVIASKILLDKTNTVTSTYSYTDNIHNRLLRIIGGGTNIYGKANEYTYNDKFDITGVSSFGTVGNVTYTYVYDGSNNWTTRDSSGGEKIARTIVYR